MTLQEQLQKDLELAITEKLSPLVRDTLKVIIAELSRGKDKIVPDEKVISVMRSLRESAIICGNDHELLVYDRYLPVMMSEEGIKDYVQLIINTEHLSGPQNIGKVMIAIKNGGLSSLIDNTIANKYAREFL